MAGFRRLLQIDWYLAFFAFSVAALRIGVTLHRHQIHHARKVLFRTDWKLERNGGAPESVVDTGQGAFKARSLAVQLVDHESARKMELRGELKYFLRLHFHTGDTVHYHHR